MLDMIKDYKKYISQQSSDLLERPPTYFSSKFSESSYLGDLAKKTSDLLQFPSSPPTWMTRTLDQPTSKMMRRSRFQLWSWMMKKKSFFGK
jgi:hypothetical protein